MSEGKRKIKVLTDVQFYKLCEAIKEGAEGLKAVRGAETLIAKLEEYLGFPLQRGALERAAEVTGVQLQLSNRKPPGRNSGKGHLHNMVRAHNTVLIKICNDLGVQVPDQLLKINEYFRSEGPGLRDEPDADFHVPVHEQPTPQRAPLPVPKLDTKNVAVANKLNSNTDRR